jgi:hypothetical protein
MLLLCGFFNPSVTGGDVAQTMTYVLIDRDFVRIGNQFLEFIITLGNNTGGGLYSIVDKAKGVDFIGRKDAVRIGFFALEYWSQQSGRYEAMLGRGAGTMSYRYAVGDLGAWLNFTWVGLSSTEEGKSYDVAVKVCINLPSGSNLSYWYIDIDNKENVIIEKVIFPLIVGVSQISDEQGGDYLVVPSWSGILCKNPSINFKPGRGIGEVYYPSGPLNMQFIAYYTSVANSGLYLADHDPEGTFVKSFTVANSEDKWLWIRNVHIPEFSPRIKMRLPYPVVIGIFEGDWWDAAQLYRSWALKQKWVAQGRIADRNDVSEWLKKSGISADVFTRFWERHSFRWNGPFANVPKIAKAMTKYYEVPYFLWWRGWEKYGFGIAPPDYLPPTEGWESFARAITEAHSYGGRIVVLPVTSHFSFNATGWQEAIVHAPKKRSGEPYVSAWTIYNNSGLLTRQAAFLMSPGEYWADIVSRVVLQLVSYGVDAVQLDGNPFQPSLDYSGSEGHVGGGTWWAESYGRMFSNIRHAIKLVNPESALCAEWFAEPYIPFIDAANEEVNTGLNPIGILGDGCYDNTLNSYIPLWHAVYHEFQLLYSTITLIDGRDMRYYLRGLAISLVWGEIPMVDMDPQGTGPPDHLNLYDIGMLGYSRRIAQARATYAYPYLVEGRMLRLPRLSGIPMMMIPAVYHIPYTGDDVPSFEWPSVVGSTWQAPDGSIGVVLTNISEKLLNVLLSLADLIPTDRSKYLAYTVRNGDFTLLSSELELHGSLNITLEPLDVYLLVLAQPNSTRAMGARLLNDALVAVESLARSGYDVKGAEKLISNATLAFFGGNYTEEQSLLESLAPMLATIRNTTDLVNLVMRNLTLAQRSNLTAPQSVQMLQLASQTLLEARSALSRHNFTRAVQLATLAQEMIGQALRTQVVYDETLSVLDSVKFNLTSAQARGFRSADARKLLEDSSKLLEAAYSLLSQFNYPSAVELAKEAQALIDSAYGEEAAYNERLLFTCLAFLVALTAITIGITLWTRKKSCPR